MVLDSEIDWELVELEAGAFVPLSAQPEDVRGSKIENLGIGDERGTTQLLGQIILYALN
jgi:hypothetical protein